MRYKGRPRKSAVVPEDFAPHDGRSCPVDPDRYVAVLNRIGTRTQPNYTAGRYSRWADDPWTWDPSKPRSGEIIAYREADGPADRQAALW